MQEEDSDTQTDSDTETSTGDENNETGQQNMNEPDDGVT